MNQSIEFLRQKKERKEKIVVVTAYDFPTAHVAERAGVDVLLVGDSLGMVVLGYETTLPVTVDDMVHHGRAVMRAARRVHVVVDLPFMSYQISAEQAMQNAARIMQETGCHAVKLEGGRSVAATVKRLVQAGIPVMGHVGLTPQSVHQLGGYRVQGRRFDAALNLWRDARALVDAGAYAIVLECVPHQLASWLSEQLPIPTIGIGAGAGCDGQVLVLHDLVGLTTAHDLPKPRFVKQYADVYTVMQQAVEQYAEDVRQGAYPAPEHTYTMDDDVLHRIQEYTASETNTPQASTDEFVQSAATNGEDGSVRGELSRAERPRSGDEQ